MSNNDPILDKAISGIRNESPDAEAVKAAANRVWARLDAETPACADYQALLPEWREGRLTPARALLLEDHLHECPACRNAAAGPRKPVVAMPAARPTAPVPAGPPAWLERAFADHHQDVYRAAHRVTGSATDAEDVLQTVFTRLLHRAKAHDRPEAPVGTADLGRYLHRAAVNAALELRRHLSEQGAAAELLRALERAGA